MQDYFFQYVNWWEYEDYFLRIYQENQTFAFESTHDLTGLQLPLRQNPNGIRNEVGYWYIQKKHTQYGI